jgi:predicted secreted protein
MKMYSLKMMYLLLVLLGINSFQPLYAKDKKLKRGSHEWYLNGPQKTWTEYDFKKYYNWREDVYRSMKTMDDDPQVLRRQKAIMNGNKITAEIWNYGSISSPGNKVTDIVWEGLGYGYEFGPFISAEVEVTANSHQDAYPKVDAQGDTTWYARVISDGLTSLGGEVSPDGLEFWGWEPLAWNDDLTIPYADPDSDKLPTSNDFDRDGDGKPDSWPSGWYNADLKEYVWPGALRQGSSNSDLEIFFVTDDRTNREFEYYPFPDDSSRKGLGLEIESRYYQWANPLAEDIIFLIFKVTNKSEKDLHEVTFGMWGDPHIGGPSNWQDDLSYFDRDINMVYAWDEDGMSDVSGRPPGYFGYKFLESPGQPYDGIDNDGDGMIDESQSNGIDDDGDWDPEKDDVGVDGVPNTGDLGEGDGQPTAGDPFDPRLPGEPNFEWTDLDESDMIGLTGFSSPPFTSQNRIANDHYVWENFLQAGVFDSANANQAGDYIFIYSTGPMTLPAGEARRFSIALVLGQDYDDLTLNAITAQDIYEKNYQFAKPPDKPNVVAVPGDERVTLYWDSKAEESFDPISESFDFEGYVIYRSIDPSFLDQQTITDANGSKFLFEPLKMSTGAPARFDLNNEYSGLSTIPYTGRGVYYNLGSNTGLVHSFIDSNNVFNGQTYYYAVVSYDHGDDSLGIAPAECSKTITLNPETNEVMLDVNTTQIVPRSPTAGFVPGQLDNDWIEHTSGVATGEISVEVIDPRALEDGNTFEITFSSNPTSYSVMDLKTVEDELYVKVDQFVRLDYANIDSNSFILTDLNGSTTYSAETDFELIYETGQFRALPSGSLVDETTYLAQYYYYGFTGSRLLSMEENNPVIDGMKIFVQDTILALDESKMSWSTGAATTWIPQIKPFNNLDTKMYPADYEIRFSDEISDSSARPGYEYIKTKFQVWETSGFVPEQRKLVIIELAPADSLWTPGDRAIILQGDETSSASWEFTFFEPAENNIPPSEGEIYNIITTRAFSGDTYQFTTSASMINQAKAVNDLNNISVVPNPYVVTNVLEPLDLQNPRDRGPRKVYFNHLPQDCTIRIFTVTGELVRTLEHHSSIDDGKEFWDLTTSDNFPIAFGIYIFHVDAGELGEKIGRLAVIK